MANFSNDTIQQAMKSSGMIPVFYHADIEVAKAVLDASYKGGVRVFEFTNRGENAFQVFSELLKHAQKYSDLMLGIGTVMDAATTQKFIAAGAHFIVSPVLKQEMAGVCQKENKLWIPGCATLTEIVTAKDLGARLLKSSPDPFSGQGLYLL
jgi:2-dehydro-3-deoxyphosphogluconate aldolase/(4S)-4-hydroxy-2-oxoglutarate aldolase